MEVAMEATAVDADEEPDAQSKRDPGELERLAFDTVEKVHRRKTNVYARILCKVLADVITSLGRGAKHAPRDRLWIQSDAEGPRTFLWVLDQLDEDHRIDFWRRLLLAIPARPRGRQPTRAVVEAVKAGHVPASVSAKTAEEIQGRGKQPYYLDARGAA